MRQLIWLEVKGLVRQPFWIVLFAFIAWLFFQREGPTWHVYMGLELPSFGPFRTIISLGEWGRVLLAAMETDVGILSSIIVALLAVNSAFAELSHREVLWATSRGGYLRFAGAKLIGLTSALTIIFVVGAGVAFLNPTVREVLSLAGWQYLPLYLTMVWIRIALWVALSIFIFFLTSSRWGSIIIVVALQVAWFTTAHLWGTPNLLRMIQRYFFSWSFISPFSPLGIIPTAFFLHGIMLVGLILALLGAVLWVRGGFLEWAKSKTFIPKAAFVLGITIALGTATGTIAMIQNQVAPFTMQELWAIDQIDRYRPGPLTRDVLSKLAHEIPATAKIVSRFDQAFDELDELSRAIPGVRGWPRGSTDVEALVSSLELISRHKPGFYDLSQKFNRINIDFAILILETPEIKERLYEIVKSVMLETLAFTRPYIWSRDWRVLVYPGEHLAVRLPRTAPVPEWVQEQAQGQYLRRLDGISYISLAGDVRQSRRESLASQSVILVQPPDSPFPRELDGVMRAFLKEVDLIAKRAEIWHEEPLKITVVWPKELDPMYRWLGSIEGPFPGEIFVPWQGLLRQGEAGRRGAAWRQAGYRLLDASEILGVSQIYLRLYLKGAINSEWVEQTLERLRATAAGKVPDVPWHRIQPSPLHPLVWGRDWGKQEAIQILHHWQQGEEMGHENYIRILLEDLN